MFDNTGSFKNDIDSGTVFSDNPISSFYSDVWMIKDLEMRGTETANKTRLQLSRILMLLARWFPHAAAGRLRSDFESHSILISLLIYLKYFSPLMMRRLH